MRRASVPAYATGCERPNRDSSLQDLLFLTWPLPPAPASCFLSFWSRHARPCDPYQPSITSSALTALFSYASRVAIFFFSISLNEVSENCGSGLYQSKLTKYFWSHGSLKTFPRRA